MAVMTSRVALVARKEGALQAGAKFRQTLLSNWGAPATKGVLAQMRDVRKRSQGEGRRGRPSGENVGAVPTYPWKKFPFRSKPPVRGQAGAQASTHSF